MKGIAAAFGLAMAIGVSSAFLNWSGQANREFCSLRIEAAKEPIRGPLAQASNGQIIYRVSGQLPVCDPSLSADQISNGITGGLLVGFFAYAFGLIFGKFRRWALR